MAWRGLHLSEPCRLSFVRNALKVERDGEDPVTVSLEDLGWVIVDTPQALLSSRLLSACADADVAVLFVDERHLPTASLIPKAGYHRQLETLRCQIEAKKPLKEKIWQSIVKQKISNQAQNLHQFKEKRATNEVHALRSMAGRVKGGDPGNIEALAAQTYWPRIFDNFSRSDDGDGRNSYLNYGYAVIRSLMARELAALGFESSLGLHHRNALNPFNLADDLFEPYRPFVDERVVQYLEETENETGRDAELDKSAKQHLASLPGQEILLNQEKMSVLNAVNKTAASLKRALRNSDPDCLEIPSFPGGTTGNGRG